MLKKAPREKLTQVASRKTMKILEARSRYIDDPKNFDRLTKIAQKLKDKDIKKRVLLRFNAELDERDIWMGIKITGKEYKIKPYARKAKGGRPIPMDKIAQKSARYLAEEQWQKYGKRVRY